MGLKKPGNWHDMTYHERAAFEKQAREFEDMEYEKEQAKEAVERAARETERAHRAAKELASEYQSRVEEYADEACDLRRELSLYKRFVDEKGLGDEFRAARLSYENE